MAGIDAGALARLLVVKSTTTAVAQIATATRANSSSSNVAILAGEAPRSILRKAAEEASPTLARAGVRSPEPSRGFDTDNSDRNDAESPASAPAKPDRSDNAEQVMEGDSAAPWTPATPGGSPRVENTSYSLPEYSSLFAVDLSRLLRAQFEANAPASARTMLKEQRKADRRQRSGGRVQTNAVEVLGSPERRPAFHQSSPVKSPSRHPSPKGTLASHGGGPGAYTPSSQTYAALHAASTHSHAAHAVLLVGHGSKRAQVMAAAAAASRGGLQLGATLKLGGLAGMLSPQRSLAMSRQYDSPARVSVPGAGGGEQVVSALVAVPPTPPSSAPTGGSPGSPSGRTSGMPLAVTDGVDKIRHPEQLADRFPPASVVIPPSPTELGLGEEQGKGEDGGEITTGDELHVYYAAEQLHGWDDVLQDSALMCTDEIAEQAQDIPHEVPGEGLDMWKEIMGDTDPQSLGTEMPVDEALANALVTNGLDFEEWVEEQDVACEQVNGVAVKEEEEEDDDGDDCATVELNVPREDGELDEYEQSRQHGSSEGAGEGASIQENSSYRLLPFAFRLGRLEIRDDVALDKLRLRHGGHVGVRSDSSSRSRSASSSISNADRGSERSERDLISPNSFHSPREVTSVGLNTVSSSACAALSVLCSLTSPDVRTDQEKRLSASEAFPSDVSPPVVMSWEQLLQGEKVHGPAPGIEGRAMKLSPEVVSEMAGAQAGTGTGSEEREGQAGLVYGPMVDETASAGIASDQIEHRRGKGTKRGQQAKDAASLPNKRARGKAIATYLQPSRSDWGGEEEESREHQSPPSLPHPSASSLLGLISASAVKVETCSLPNCDPVMIGSGAGGGTSSLLSLSRPQRDRRPPPVMANLGERPNRATNNVLYYSGVSASRSVDRVGTAGPVMLCTQTGSLCSSKGKKDRGR